MQVTKSFLWFVLLSTICVHSAGATIINVPPDHLTIQAGVTAAAPGDTVLVGDGTYVENVLINKNITLLSVNGRAAATIQGISSAGALGSVQVTSNTTALQIGGTGQGFTIVGIDNGSPGVENAAVYFQGAHSNAQVLDNEIVANGDHGLLTEYGAVISGFVIDGNEFSGQTFLGPNPAGEGFGQQFTLPNVPRQLCVMGGGGGGGNTSNTTFTNNQVTGVAGGLNVLSEEQGNTLVTMDSNVAVVTGNLFAGTTTRFATSLRCRGPNSTISGNTFDSTGLVDPPGAVIPWQTAGHVYLQNIGTNAAGVASTNTFDKAVYVDGPVATIYWSIQRGVFDTVSGSTLNVLPGTYVEQIVIDGTDITLQGAGCGSSIIESPATLVSTFSTTSGAKKPIVTVKNAATVQIDGFTIDGLGLGNANADFLGVAYWNAGGALLNSCVVNVQNTPFSGAQHGVGVACYNDDGGPYSLEVGNVLVSTFQKNAMALTGAGMTLDVHDCTVTGAGYTPITAQNGIQISSGAGGTVRDNTISDIGYIGSPWAAGGLLILSGTTVNATGTHTITDVQVPAWWQDTSGSIAGINASGQIEYGHLLYNLTASRRPEGGGAPPVEASPVVEPSAGSPFRATETLTLSESCLDGTTAPTPFVGIYGYSAGGPLDISATNMDIAGFDYGIVADGAATSFDISVSSITQSITTGYDNTLSGNAQDATLNWWGAADGPGGDGAGSGDAVASVGGEVSFDPFLTDGTSSTSCAFTPTANTVTPNPGVDPCISTIDPCIPVSFDIARTDNANMRGFSVTFQLSSELILCNGLASITEGTYLNAIGGTAFQTLDNTGGSYTVDGAILGIPCGATAPAGTLFDIDVKASGGDGTGTITVTSVIFRDCVNAPIPSAAGAPASILIDTAGPVAVGDIASAQVKTGNDSDGTTKITLTFTAPGDASVVEVYRAPYSDGAGVNAYPEYDDVAGAGPPAIPSYPPAAPWAVTGVMTTGATDETAARGYWYFVMFTKDACGNVSAVSNMAGGTLNYHLGDVSDGITAGQGDNLVATADMSLLGFNYGNALIFNDPVNYLDVGPTADFSVNTLPSTDNAVQFEDLMMFAINFGQVSAPQAPPEDGIFEVPVLSLELSQESVNVGDVLEARLLLHENVDMVKGLHAQIAASGLELMSVRQGSLVSSQADPVFFKDLETPQGVSVDLAVLGAGKTVSGEGELAVLTLRVVDPSARPELISADFRGRANRRLGSGTQSVDAPTGQGELSLLGAYPNPFRGSTDIVFRIPDRRPVSVTVYDVSGRLVRRLADRPLDAGEHRLAWDGRDGSGQPVGSGIYFYAFQAGELKATRRLVHTR